MKNKTVVKAIIKKGNTLLLQLRDNKPTIPYPNTWSLFGGGVEDNEDPASALTREIAEELPINISKPKLLVHRTRSEQEFLVDEYIFEVDLSAQDLPVDLTTKEGQAARFFNSYELISINLNPIYRELVDEYLLNLNRS